MFCFFLTVGLNLDSVLAASRKKRNSSGHVECESPSKKQSDGDLSDFKPSRLEDRVTKETKRTRKEDLSPRSSKIRDGRHGTKTVMEGGNVSLIEKFSESVGGLKHKFENRAHFAADGHVDSGSVQKRDCKHFSYGDLREKKSSPIKTGGGFVKIEAETNIACRRIAEPPPGSPKFDTKRTPQSPRTNNFLNIFEEMKKLGKVEERRVGKSDTRTNLFGISTGNLRPEGCEGLGRADPKSNAVGVPKTSGNSNDDASKGKAKNKRMRKTTINESDSSVGDGSSRKKRKSSFSSCSESDRSTKTPKTTTPSFTGSSVTSSVASASTSSSTSTLSCHFSTKVKGSTPPPDGEKYEDAVG